MTADPRIDRWLKKDRPWQDEMHALRSILLSEGLDEALKWRKPCYSLRGHGNVAIIAPMKDVVGLSFFKGVLPGDRSGLLVPVGPNSRSAKWAKFAGVGEIEAAEGALRDLIRQAARAEAEGRRPDMPGDDLELPAELRAELAGEEDFAEAWEALTPGRRRGWVLQIASAKQSTTRARRVRKARAAIFAGKGWNER